MGSDLRKHERGKNKGDRKEQVSKGYINDRDTAVDNSYSFLAAPLWENIKSMPPNCHPINLSPVKGWPWECEVRGMSFFQSWRKPQSKRQTQVFAVGLSHHSENCLPQPRGNMEERFKDLLPRFGQNLTSPPKIFVLGSKHRIYEILDNNTEYKQRSPLLYQKNIPVKRVFFLNVSFFFNILFIVQFLNVSEQFILVPMNTLSFKGLNLSNY